MNPALLALLGARVKAASTITDTFNRADMPPPAIGAPIELSLALRDLIPLAG